MNRKFEASLNSRATEVKCTVLRIMEFIEANCERLLSDEKFYLRLMFSELLFNAMRHGNKSDIRKHVYVTVVLNDEGINATVSDEGGGFDYEGLTNALKEKGSDLEDEGGRGIQLVYALADEMTFNVSGNEIGFFKRIDTGG